MHHKFVIYPFTAIVGQELMKKALIVNAVDPTVGGVLIKGDKGTGKSTAVRALADLLPHLSFTEGCPFNCHPENERLMCKSCQQRYEAGEILPRVTRRMEIVDMPLSATEDMVIGTIDIRRALAEGIKALEPGILARANRNILYIDEVNLLDDHLVNILLDAAAMGVNVIEREGISLYHPSRFILVGTMNPEEGDLRPQILDRFGLSVDVQALQSKEDRLAVMKHRRDFDTDPWNFFERFRVEQERLSRRITEAQERLAEISIPDAMRERIVTITTGLGIRTHRADIVMEKTAAVLAAIQGNDAVEEAHVTDAALLALPHRMRQLPFDREKGISVEMIERLTSGQMLEEIADFDRNATVKKKPLT